MTAAAGTIDGARVRAALVCAAERLVALRDTLTDLDAAMGDGDCGVTMAKGGGALLELLAKPDAGGGEDLGKLLTAAGVTFNRVAPSTLGTVVATALMRAGREARGLVSLDAAALARMLTAADVGVRERGEASIGDKTIVDALQPAAEAFAAEIERGGSLEAAAATMLQAARAGRDRAIPLVSKKGRGSWTGDRSRDQPDPGTVMLVGVLEAVLGAESSAPGNTR